MTTNFPAVMNVDDLTSALASSQVQETNGGGQSFLKMDFETGEWLLGQDAEEVTGESILILTDSIAHGWILWSGGKPKKSMVRFLDPLPIPMPSVGNDHPSEGRSLLAAMVDDQEMVQFDTNSFGGRKGVDKILSQIKAHAAAGSKYLYPKVKLTSESYANKQRGGKLVFNPIFELISWCDSEGNEEGGAKVPIEAKPAPVAEEAEAPAPGRQRRKRGSTTA